MRSQTAETFANAKRKLKLVTQAQSKHVIQFSHYNDCDEGCNRGCN